MADLTQFEITPYSENAILVKWPSVISAVLHQRLIAISSQVAELKPWFIEQVCSYHSLLIYYRFEAISAAEFSAKVANIIEHHSNQEFSADLTGKTITIDVLYNHQSGWDNALLCQEKNCTLEDIIKWHTGRSYRAYALGFTPGFCYLASVDEKLSIPRKTVPRKRVPAGAVAIAHKQTAIYPDSSPGGWHIIGQTAQPMYQMTNNEFTPLINVGDIVTFKAVSQEDFIAQGGKLIKEY
ncbi:allophanate hydrolase subunit 1 [Thalassotalea sp. LPB0316]|uniref:5-oxoprolinase subunit B family protein n=1 Tax=Thalassotalea sp. LPB0316 TaxID=2769490 RepID=UPI0018687598|nr:allophanate hydrolase subunit 1 [Thalassotalea sp. LPB0316]QOL26083.1 allophanate hydrolase subunit 1 [Thalassotalea sp. LPB0316]